MRLTGLRTVWFVPNTEHYEWIVGKSDREGGPVWRLDPNFVVHSTTNPRREAPGFGTGSALINDESSGARCFASNQRDKNHDWSTGLSRFPIQLKFIYSICQTLYSWPGCEFR